MKAGMMSVRDDDWHMDVPTPEGREPLKIALFKGSMQVGQEARSCSFIPSQVRRAMDVDPQDL
jgi:hypothetical protein